MLKSALVMMTATAIAFTGFNLQPAAAAPGIGKQQTLDLSAARKKRRGHGRGFPLAAFGAVAGTIAGIAAAQRRRDYYEAPYGYYGPGYLYDAPVAAPYAYGPPAYQYGGHGYHGGYRHIPGGAAPQYVPQAPTSPGY